MKATVMRERATSPLTRDWADIERSLDTHGNAVLPGILNSDQCEALAALYAQDDAYRSRIIMARYGFGQGEYKYFAYPLPPLIDELRHELYRGLAPIANRWNQQLGTDVQYPDELDAFLQRCHDAGQTRPTPLMLHYTEGDYNCLHRDLYGVNVFPLQATILLSKPGEDFLGGEFVMTELSARSQRVEAVPLCQGDAVVFAVNERPTMGKRGIRKAAMRHGVSRIRRGERYTAGLIFHDAQ